MDQYILIVALLLNMAAWGAKFRRLIGEKGFDPSLITYADPLTFNNSLGYRASFTLGGLAELTGLSSLSRFILCMAIASAAIHISIIFIFGRQSTQPTSYYALTLIGAGSLVLFKNWPVFIICIVIQELLLLRWKKVQKRRYDRWVERLAGQINLKYKKISAEMPAEDWRWVLHIAVTESIARPAVVRWAERLYYRFKKPATISTGIMQIRGSKPISDSESMKRGSEIIRGLLKIMPNGLDHNGQMAWLAKSYNGSYGYGVYLKSTYPGVADAWNKIHGV